jgi:hypothetical protein
MRPKTIVLMAPCLNTTVPPTPLWTTPPNHTTSVTGRKESMREMSNRSGIGNGPRVLIKLNKDIQI